LSRPANREQYRDAVVQGFIKALEEDGLEWKKMWRGGADAPVNGVTGRPYSGVNRLWLSLAAIRLGCSDPRWVTMTQIMDRGGTYHPGEEWHLRKGSRAEYVEYWFRYDTSSGKTLSWKEYASLVASGRDPSEFRLVPRYTAVFSASMVDGIGPAPEARTPAQHDELVDEIAARLCVPITYDGGNSAYYLPGDDSIHLPAKESFVSDEALNAVTLHELAHSTGHPSRLNRFIRGSETGENYAYEELVAEIASCFVSFSLSSEMTESMMENHKAYVNAWISAIRERPDTLLRAARDAQKAADMMEGSAARELDAPEPARARAVAAEI